MPVWLTLFGALCGTAGLLGGFYFVVVSLLEGRKAKARPRIGISPGETPGTLGVWANWDPAVFAIEIYRIRVHVANPWGQPKEATLTYSFDPAQKGPFHASIELPDFVRSLIENEHSPNDALLTIDVRTIQELTLPVYLHLKKVRRFYKGKSTGIPAGLTRVGVIAPDAPAVLSLDFEEWQARKKKIRDLEAAAKAKAAKAPPKPAAPPPTAPGTSETAGKTAAAPEPPRKLQTTPDVPTLPMDVKKAASVSKENLPSLKELIAQVNAQGKATT